MPSFLSRRKPVTIYSPPPAPPAPTSAALLADLAAARAGTASSSQLAALGAAGLAASVGYTAGAEGLLGTLTLNPYTAIPAAALLIADLTGLIPSFAGKPKLLDSAQAAQRLLASPFLPLQRLGERIAIFVKNGVPLSTGDPAYQQQIRTAIQGTVATILQQYPLAGTPASVDALVNRALTSQSGTSATASLNSLLARSAVLAPQKPASAPLPPIISSGSTNTGTPAMAAQSSPALPANTPFTLKQLFQQIQPYLGEFEKLELVGCLSAWTVAVLTEGQIATTIAVKCLEKLAVTIVAQGAKQVIQSMINFIRQSGDAIRSALGGQPSGSPAPRLPATQPATLPAPGPVPLVLNQPCEACMTPTERAQYQREQTLLSKEIQTETQQDTQQQLDQIQTELDQLQELESQPLSQRNIQQELEHKGALQRQLDQIGQQRGEPPPPGTQPPLVTQPLDQFPIPQKQPSASEAITFCVGCQSNEDAILFLNGEPSACSVIPGSTKPLIGSAAA